MNSERIDVLAVMDAIDGWAREVSDEFIDSEDGMRAGYAQDLRDHREAMRAVSDLITQSNAPAVAYGCLSSTGVHFVSDDRDECVEESRLDGSLVVELIVRPFALARVGAP